MKKIFLPMAAVSFLLAGVWILGKQKAEMRDAFVEQLPRFGKISSLNLTDQDGEAMTIENLHGHVWIANFIFTRCMGPCPLMTKKMVTIQKDLNLHTNMRFVSISVDPDHDRPEVLREYGVKHQADFSKWWLLTGEKQQIIDLAVKMFHVPAGEDPNMHGTKFILVDASGEVRGYFDASDASETEKLIDQAKALATASLASSANS